MKWSKRKDTRYIKGHPVFHGEKVFTWMVEWRTSKCYTSLVPFSLSAFFPTVTRFTGRFWKKDHLLYAAVSKRRIKGTQSTKHDKMIIRTHAQKLCYFHLLSPSCKTEGKGGRHAQGCLVLFACLTALLTFLSVKIFVLSTHFVKVKSSEL